MVFIHSSPVIETDCSKAVKMMVTHAWEPRGDQGIPSEEMMLIGYLKDG